MIYFIDMGVPYVQKKVSIRTKSRIALSNKHEEEE